MVIFLKKNELNWQKHVDPDPDSDLDPQHWIEGSGVGFGAGSIPLSNGFGSISRRPKNIRIRRIRIRNIATNIRVCGAAG
jgi:hypothetical protein